MLDFRFPDIGEGITEGKLLKWMVKVGDKIKEGDSLFLVETDKVNAEIPSPEGGIITALQAEEGDIIYVGNIIVSIDNEASALTNKLQMVNEDVGENSGVVGAIEVSSEVIKPSHEGVATSVTSMNKVLATPVSRKLAKDLGIDINLVTGSGPVGRVMKEDIYKAKKELDTITQGPNTTNRKEVLEETSDTTDREKILKETSDTTNQEEVQEALDTINCETVQESIKIKLEVPKLKLTGEIERIPLTMHRKAIAKNMVLSKSVIPHAAVLDEFDVTKLVEFRSNVKEMAKSNGIHLTYLPFVIKALALALKEFPVFNSSFDEEKYEIVVKKYYNIGVAVDTPEGLLVPVIKDADKMGIYEIATELTRFSEGAKNRSLPIEVLQNGTFTITNYGTLGLTSGIPIIRHPESAILGIGKIGKKPIVNSEGEVVVRNMMNSLCIDHRVIDGGDAGRFLNKLKQYLEEPIVLLLN